jgi:hypothetical protein
MVYFILVILSTSLANPPNHKATKKNFKTTSLIQGKNIILGVLPGVSDTNQIETTKESGGFHFLIEDKAR